MAKGKGRIRVGTALAVPGQRVEGRLVLSEYADAPVASPVIIAAGRRPGPVLWAQGCIHGTEVGGTLGLLRFVNGLDLKSMRGAVVAVMLANPYAFRAGARNTPYDGENLNRVFPGARNAGTSGQMADTLLGNALRVADAVVDLHSGGDRSIVPFYALYWNNGSPAATRAAALARAAATSDIWASTDRWLAGAMFAKATERGTPGLIIECGGGGQVKDADIDNFAAALTGIARALGIVPGEAPRQPRYREHDDARLVYSTRGGIFHAAVASGATVEKDAVLGCIVDLYGHTVETVTAPIGPSFVASIRKAYMPVYSGEQIAECIGVLDR
jgi:predicted deacylase